MAKPNQTHGHGGNIKSAEYKTWRGMKSRCYIPSDTAYARYGGRGIKMSARWRKSFSAFLADMGPKPLGFTIERIKNSRGYFPSNCRWASKEDQAKNRSNNVMVAFRGEQMRLIDCIAASGTTASYKTVIQRIQKYGWPIERALTNV